MKVHVVNILVYIFETNVALSNKYLLAIVVVVTDTLVQARLLEKPRIKLSNLRMQR